MANLAFLYVQLCKKLLLLHLRRVYWFAIFHGLLGAGSSMRFISTIIATMGRAASVRMEESRSRGVCGAVAAMVVVAGCAAAACGAASRRAANGVADLLGGVGFSGGGARSELDSAIGQGCSPRL